MKEQSSLSQWLEERCQREHLSLRQAAARTGLSHATIADIIKGVRPLPETIRKLATGFGGDGTNQQIALEDHLQMLAGYRIERPERKETSMERAALLDKVDKLTEPQLKMVGYFADFLVETKGKTEAALLKKVADLEDILAMKEPLCAPEEEAISLLDYARS